VKTIALNLVKAKMSQAKLAEKARFRQAAVSQIETGKREITATDLLYFSYSLNKPVTYFSPNGAWSRKAIRIV
jgi:transcriptional regulator with XRE-family HTH domain